MKLNRILFAGALMTLAACSNDNDDTAGQVAMTVEASIEDVVTTRMSDTSWDKTDSIGISVSNNNGGTTTGTNVKYTTSAGDGKFTSATPIYFNDNKTVVFSAYYPYTASSKLSNGKIAVDTKTQANQKTFDYLYGTGSGSMASVNGITNMSFNHKMAKISFTFKAGTGIADNTTLANGLAATYKVSGLKHEGTFNTTSGAIEVTSTAAADITPAKSITSLIVMPQKPSEVKIVLTYKDVAYTASIVIPTDGYAAGKNYNYTITVNETGLVVSRSTIVNWSSSNQAGSNAEYEYPNDITDESSDYTDMGWEEDDLEFKTNN